MDVFTAMKISASGMALQRARMNVISSNLANANTTRTAQGGPYRRKMIISGAVPVEEGSFSKTLDSSLKKVKVLGVKEDQSPPRMVYDPSHPDADERGYVAMPNVNTLEEMMDMINTTRAYEANATAVNNAKAMAAKALELGQR